MKKLIPFIPVALLLCVAATARSWTNNGYAPGVTASATPISVGTSTPVAVVTCATSLYGTGGKTLYLDFAVNGGTAGTDSCYVLPAASASPCAAASPAPNANLARGYPLPTGGSGWQHTVINFPSAGGASILSSEWDAVCTAASMKVSPTTLP